MSEQTTSEDFYRGHSRTLDTDQRAYAAAVNAEVERLMEDYGLPYDREAHPSGYRYLRTRIPEPGVLTPAEAADTLLNEIGAIFHMEKAPMVVAGVHLSPPFQGWHRVQISHSRPS